MSKYRDKDVYQIKRVDGTGGPKWINREELAVCPVNPGIIPESVPAEGDKESRVTSGDEEPPRQFIVLKQNRFT